MRKLSELLPIARQFLVNNDHSWEDSQHDVYTCHAAEKAWLHGRMTRDEQQVLRDAIEAELYRQSDGYNCSISGYLGRFHDFCYSMYSPEYFVRRDQWLDEFQAKLEADERFALEM